MAEMPLLALPPTRNPNAVSSEQRSCLNKVRLQHFREVALEQASKSWLIDGLCIGWLVAGHCELQFGHWRLPQLASWSGAAVWLQPKQLTTSICFASGSPSPIHTVWPTASPTVHSTQKGPERCYDGMCFSPLLIQL